MAVVVKWLTHQIVALAFRGFDSHRPPHIRNQLLVYQGVFILLKYIFYRNKNDLKFYEGIFKIKFYRL